MPSWHTIIQVPTLTIHADPDASLLQRLGKGLAGELRSLVGAVSPLLSAEFNPALLAMTVLYSLFERLTSHDSPYSASKPIKARIP